MSIHLMRSHPFGEQIPDMCTQMAEEYDKSHNLSRQDRSDHDSMVRFVRNSFVIGEHDVDVILRSYNRRPRMKVADFYRMANREVYGNGLPNRVHVRVEHRPINQHNAYRLLKRPTSTMAILIVPTLDIASFSTVSMLNAMRKLLTTIVSIDDFGGMRQREQDFARRHSQIPHTAV